MSVPLTNKQKLSPITPNANVSNFGPNSLVTQSELPQATTQKCEDLRLVFTSDGVGVGVVIRSVELMI